MAHGRVTDDDATERRPSILIIDADVEHCTRLCGLLAAHGLPAEAVHDGRRGLARAFGRHYDLLLLDSALPDRAGLGLLRALRRRTDVPIVMLTPQRSHSDRIAALDAGADDTISEPFEPEELAARLRALLRRSQRSAPAGPSVLAVNGIRLDPGTRDVLCDGAPVRTTAIEFQILELLLGSAGHVVSRAEIISILHRRPATPFDRSLDVHISHLRKKLGPRGGLIRTVRGVGYLFCAEAEPPSEDC